MEEKSSSFWKSGLTYGLILGLILIIYSVLLYVMDQSFNKGLGYISFIFIFAVLFYGTKTFRDNNLDGYISYGHALGFGMIIILFAGIFSSIYFAIHITLIDSDYITKLLAFSEEQLLNKNMPDEQIEMALEMQKKMMKPLIMSILGFINTAFFGLIMALISSAIVKKQGDPYQAVMQDIEE